MARCKKDSWCEKGGSHARTRRGDRTSTLRTLLTLFAHSYGSLTKEIYVERAKQLTEVNKGLQFAEGEKRGYFTLRFTPTELTTKYYGIDDNNNGQSTESLLATFEVKRGANKFTRPINGGKNSTHGALQSLQYDQSSWNGTYFTVAK